MKDLGLTFGGSHCEESESRIDLDCVGGESSDRCAGNGDGDDDPTGKTRGLLLSVIFIKMAVGTGKELIRLSDSKLLDFVFLF